MDLQAHDMENTVHVELKQPAVIPENKTTRISSLTTKVKDCCVVCKAGKHLLRAWNSSQAFPHSKKVAVVRKIRLCLNCLKPRHFVRQCSCDYRCNVCQGPHYTLNCSIFTGAVKGN